MLKEEASCSFCVILDRYPGAYSGADLSEFQWSWSKKKVLTQSWHVYVCVFLSVARHAVFYPQCLQMCPVGLQCRVAVGFKLALTEFVVCDLIFLNVQYGHSDVDVVFCWV